MKTILLIFLICILTFIITFISVNKYIYYNRNCSNSLKDNFWCQKFSPVEITIIDYFGTKAVGTYNNNTICHIYNDIQYVKRGTKMDGFFQIQNPSICSTEWSLENADKYIHKLKTPTFMNGYSVIISCVSFFTMGICILCIFNIKENDEIDLSKINFCKINFSKINLSNIFYNFYRPHKNSDVHKNIQIQLEEGVINGPNMNESCGICLDEYSSNNKQLVSLKCAHWFHKDCLELHLKTNKLCPICIR